MPRVRVAPALGLVCLSAALAGCSAASPGGSGIAGQTPPAGQWTLYLKSEPPGAEAKSLQGPSCRTPCQIVLPMADTSVTFTLAGYAPQTIPITWLPATFHYEMYERTDQGGAIYPVDFSPNPAIAQLLPGGTPGAPEPAPRKPAPKPKKTAN
jgi:hypothetical protein